MKDETHTLSSGGTSVIVAAHGAELQSLRNADGHELLWQAGSQWPCGLTIGSPRTSP